MGYIGVLISQHQDNTDAALRRVAGWRIRMTNQRERVRLLGLRVMPIPFFIASYFPANDPLTPQAKPQFYERFFLTWHKKLYDSHGIFAGLFDDLAPLGDRITLPAPG